MKESNHIKSLVLFAVLAALSYGLYEYRFSKESSWQFKPFTKGYALFDSEIQFTGDDGVIHTSIASPEIIFYADSEETVIKQPVMFYNSGDTQWRMESSEAQINAKQSEIFFPQAVVLKTLNSESNTEINTSALTMFPEMKKAETKAHMEWLQAQMIMSGEGSVIDLNLQEIEVLDETHAEFNP